jgi:RNase P subunit RPR2
MGKCNHPLMAWAFRGSRSGPDKNNNFTLYDCLECGIRFRYYFNQNRVEELPKNIGLIPAIW